MKQPNERANDFKPTSSLTSPGDFRAWLIRYRWHILFWLGYFVYAFITDSLLYGKYIYFSKEVLFISSHPVFLFYAFLFCLGRFSKETPVKIAFSISSFIIVIAIFWAIRITLNYKIYPLMDVARGIEQEKLDLHIFIINGIFWNTEFLVKSLAYFFIVKYIRKQRQLQKALEDNMVQERALSQKRLNEERAQQLKKEYEQREITFVNLVHETKTPLTLINNYLEEYLSKTKTTPELTVIKNSIFKLTRDMSNIFEMERFLRGFEIFNNRQVTNFSEVLQDNLVLFDHYCKSLKISLVHHVAPGILTKADPNAINSIINNLIGNAIKFSNGGQIKITLNVQEDKIRFMVRDDGPGIRSELQKKVFEPYFQINAKDNRGQGMGLGLPLLKKTIEGLNGKIFIVSAPEERPGTTVIVELPEHILVNKELVESFTVPEKEPVTLRQLELIDSEPVVGRSSIMIVEDNKAMLSYLHGKLVAKYTVYTATNGREAIKKMKEENKIPNLIISDVMMDKLDGFGLAKIIAETDTLNHIPILFLSARFTKKDRVRGLQLGAIDYLPKPFSIEELSLKLDSLLKNTSRHDQALLANAIRGLQALEKSDTNPKDNLTGDFEQNCKIYALTSREIEIVKLIAEGATYKSISGTLFISETTVATHARNIFEKTGVSNKTQLINKLSA